MQRYLRDPVTWKSLVFVALKFPLGVLTFGAVVALGWFALVLLFAPLIVLATTVTIFGWIVTSPVQALPLCLLGIPAVLLVLHLSNGLGWLWALFARVMLGPSTVQLHERVDDLRDARARIIAAGDAERRRIERDLHDGAQQHLVALSLTLGMAESRLKTDPEAVAPLIAQAREEAALAVKELRTLASGIHPALLTERGLGPALDALAARAPVPTTVEGVPAQRLPPPIESAVYFVTAEALTNVAKYAGAMSASVSLTPEHGRIRLIVRDDGAGGADTERRHRPARAARPRRGARRPVPRRLPARPRHDADRRDPAGRPRMRLLLAAAARRDPRRRLRRRHADDPDAQRRLVRPARRQRRHQRRRRARRQRRRRGHSRREGDRPRRHRSRAAASCTCTSAIAGS